MQPKTRHKLREVEKLAGPMLLGAAEPTRAQIDEGVMNDRLGKELWTTELHFPGSQIYDMLLNLDDLPPVKKSGLRRLLPD